MSEELKEEMKKLKDELRELKERLNNEGKEKRKQRRGIYIDLGERVQDYVGDVMEGVAEGIHGELEKSIFVGPHGRHIRIRGPGLRADANGSCESEDKQPDFDESARVMSALGQEHRLKILCALMRGGKYVNELQEELPDIAASTLSSHLNVLEEAGLVVQERVRGRYLITIPGRSAYKMTRKISRLLKGRKRE
ncbi:MAG: winged helix-turn-helix transcriptional regulator [Candidatus Bathyarchaeota archaeon]|nr:MAG: winged helix-turn-helix transcriptional regulator [Candidatus Bathyarchaeota archaeon]